jgi:hypothetical protein
MPRMTLRPVRATALAAMTALSACSAVPGSVAHPRVTPAPAAVVKAVESLDTDPANYATSPRTHSFNDPAGTAPPGSKIVALRDTWSADGPHGGVITAVYKRDAAPDKHYTLAMVQEGGQWKVQTLLAG